MDNALLSVIVPVYNVENYLCDCVSSLLRQDFDRYEILLIDDGSTDSSGHICDEYSQKYENIRTIHKENGGLGSARNVGVKNAVGKYITFLDSDDYYEANCISHIVNEMEENQLDILLFGAHSFSDDGSEPTIKYSREKTKLGIVQSGVEGVEQALKTGEYVTSVCLRAYNRDFYNEVGIEFNELYIHEDIDVSFLTYLKAKRTKIIDQKYYGRRIHEGSIMTSRSFSRALEGIKYAWKSINSSTACVDGNYAPYVQLFSEWLIKTILIMYFSLDPEKKRENYNRIDSFLNECGDKPMHNKFLKFASHHLQISALAFTMKKRMILVANSLIERAKLAYHEPNSLFTCFKITIHSKNSFFLLGTPHHGNIGDHLIASTELELFKNNKRGMGTIDCTMGFSKTMLGLLRRRIRPGDIIVISGGGWLGSEWRKNEDFVRLIIYLFPRNRIIIMPQTAYYRDEDGYMTAGIRIYRSHPDLFFFAREKNTYKLFYDKGFVEKDKIFEVPDMALLSCLWKTKQSVGANAYAERRNIAIYLRNDREALLDDILRDRIISIIKRYDSLPAFVRTNEARRSISPFCRKKRILRKMEEISRHKLLVTDGLHAMIIAAITETPCIVMDNSTHKVSGVYEWIKELDYIRLVESPDELESCLDEMTKTHFESHYKDLDFSSYRLKMLDLLDRENNYE